MTLSQISSLYFCVRMVQDFQVFCRVTTSKKILKIIKKLFLLFYFVVIKEKSGLPAVRVQ